MTDTQQPGSDEKQQPRRKRWRWMIMSLMALLIALLIALCLTVWESHKERSDLLGRIRRAGGNFQVDTSARPKWLSSRSQFPYIYPCDKIVSLWLFYELPAPLFHDAMATFPAVEELELQLENSSEIDRGMTSRMPYLRGLVVNADKPVDSSSYSFLAGCPKVTRLELRGGFHDDRFWRHLPEMTALSHLELIAGSDVRGEGIPDLSKSNLNELKISGEANEFEFIGLATLLTAPNLESLDFGNTTVVDPNKSVVDFESLQFAGSPTLKKLTIINAGVTDQIFPVLSHCTSLSDLRLEHNQITGESLELLASLPIWGLTLDYNPLSAEACRGLSRFSNLRYLHLQNTGVKSEWLTCWADSPLESSLGGLRLSVDSIDEAAIEVLNSFSKLRDLSLSGDDWSDEAVLQLADHPSLEYLTVSGTISDELIERFRERVKARGATRPSIRRSNRW